MTDDSGTTTCAHADDDMVPGCDGSDTTAMVNFHLFRLKYMKGW